MVSVTIGGFVPESEGAELLGATEKAHEGVSIGSYPFFKEGRVGANFVVTRIAKYIPSAVAAVTNPPRRRPPGEEIAEVDENAQNHAIISDRARAWRLRRPLACGIVKRSQRDLCRVTCDLLHRLSVI